MLLRCIRAENRKLRRSPIWLLFLAVPAISAVYGTFNYNMNLEILTHGWYDLWTQYTLFYAIFFFAPLIGVYAAYLWRLEHRGHNWNLIMTAPVRPFFLYFAKFCVVTKMAVLTQGWMLALFIIGGKCGAKLPGFPPPEIVLWLLLSIRFDNQVPTLAAGMVGSLSGLFAAFIPSLVSYFLPWGYYIPLSAIRMDWNRETRIVRYYPAPYPVWLLALTAAFGALFAALAWETLKRKEV